MHSQYSAPPYGYQGPGAYYGLRASMNPTSSPLVGTPQAPGVYPGVPVGQWGSHPVPHGQVGYSAPAIPGGVAPFPVGPPSAPSYNAPSKSSKQNKSQPNIPPAPKPPERPLQPYMRYSKENFEKVKAENQDLKLQDISRILGARWKALNDKDKQRYLDEWEAEKVTYSEQLKVYHNSPVYKAWLEAKHQAEMQAKRAAMLEQQRAYTPPPPQVIPTTQMTGMSVAPVEDEECEFTTMQQVAAARYQRNHRLMAEIFNDVVIPVVKPSVDENKVSSLSEQVETLTQHQKKLEVELEELEAAYQRKRRKVRKDGQHFLKEMKRLRETPLSLQLPPKKGPPPAKIPPLPAADSKYITL